MAGVKYYDRMLEHYLLVTGQVEALADYFDLKKA